MVEAPSLKTLKIRSDGAWSNLICLEMPLLTAGRGRQDPFEGPYPPSAICPSVNRCPPAAIYHSSLTSHEHLRQASASLVIISSTPSNLCPPPSPPFTHHLLVLGARLCSSTEFVPLRDGAEQQLDAASGSGASSLHCCFPALTNALF